MLFDEFLGEKASEKRALEIWSQETGLKTVQIAEFMRDPSGWGTALDQRALFQVIKDEPLSKVPTKESFLRNQLKRRPMLYEQVKRIYNLFR